MDVELNEMTNVDINPLRGIEDLTLFDEFNQWFAGNITVDRDIQHSKNFFGNTFEERVNGMDRERGNYC